MEVELPPDELERLQLAAAREGLEVRLFDEPVLEDYSHGQPEASVLGPDYHSIYEGPTVPVSEQFVRTMSPVDEMIERKVEAYRQSLYRRLEAFLDGAPVLFDQDADELPPPEGEPVV